MTQRDNGCGELLELGGTDPFKFESHLKSSGADGSAIGHDAADLNNRSPMRRYRKTQQCAAADGNFSFTERAEPLFREVECGNAVAMV